MENLLKIAKLFIFNITVVLRKTSEISQEINYVPYEVEVINNNRSMTYKMLINRLFIREDDTIKILTNQDFIHNLLIDYIYKIDDKSFKNKVEETFNINEMKLLLENFKLFSRFKYIECMRI